MAKSFRDATEDELYNIDIIEEMESFIRKNWEGCNHIRPKNYKEIKEKLYTDDEIDTSSTIEELHKGFTLLNTDERMIPFPESTHVSEIVRQDCDQGRSPLTMLLRSAFDMGRAFGSRHEQVYNLSDTSSKFRGIEHHIKMMLSDLTHDDNENYKSLPDGVYTHLKKLMDLIGT